MEILVQSLGGFSRQWLSNPLEMLTILNVTIVFLSVVVGYLIYVLIQGLFSCPTRHLPGPFISRFTRIPNIFNMFGGTHCMDVEKLHQKYGPVVRLAPNLVSVMSLDVVLQGWAGQNARKIPWNKDPDFCNGVRGGLEVDNVLSIPTAKESQRMRRLVGQPFAKKFLLDQGFLFKKCTKRMIERLDNLRRNQNDIVEISYEFKSYSIDILTEFAFGGYYKPPPIESGLDVLQLAERFPLANTLVIKSPLLYKLAKRLPFKALEWVHSRDQFIQVCDMSIREYLRNVEKGSRKDALGLLLAAVDDSGSSLSYPELVGAASIFLVAGVDTTAMALTFIAYELARHPDLFDKLAKELSKYQDIDSLDLVDLEKLPLLNAVIQESLRLYPPAPSEFGRVCPPQGITVSGLSIPPGTIICRLAWPVCHDPLLYPDPYAFKPERWLNLTREEETKLWDQSMIFSYGPRVCLGKEMALMELRILVSALIMNYTWTGVPDVPGKWEEEMKPRDAVLLVPWKGKCVVDIKERRKS